MANEVTPISLACLLIRCFRRLPVPDIFASIFLPYSDAVAARLRWVFHCRLSRIYGNFVTSRYGPSFAIAAISSSATSW
jgi:hypothetical protein